MLDNILKYKRIWVIISLAVLSGCIKSTFIPTHPIHLGTQSATAVNTGVRIGLAKIQTADNSKNEDRRIFMQDIGIALENGMLEACRLIDPKARFADPKDAGEFDLFLIPDNPYYEVEKNTYGFSVMISMEVILTQKGQNRKRGILIDVQGHPLTSRPHRMIKIFNTDYGLVGVRVPGNPMERAINNALFNFSIKFAKNLEKRVKRFLEDNPDRKGKVSVSSETLQHH